MLTSREKEILELIGKGYRNKDITTELGLSPHTVRTHLSRTYMKLRVHNRTGAVVNAHRQGFLNLKTLVQQYPHLLP